MPGVIAVTFSRSSCLIMPGVNEVAEALLASRTAWNEATRDGAAACGTDVTEQAYTRMQAALFAELGAHIEVQSHGQ